MPAQRALSQYGAWVELIHKPPGAEDAGGGRRGRRSIAESKKEGCQVDRTYMCVNRVSNLRLRRYGGTGVGPASTRQLAPLVGGGARGGGGHGEGGAGKGFGFQGGTPRF